MGIGRNYFPAGDVDGDGDEELLLVPQFNRLKYIEGEPNLLERVVSFDEFPSFPIVS